VGHTAGCRAGPASPRPAKLDPDTEAQTHASSVLCSTITHPSCLRRASMFTERRSRRRRCTSVGRTNRRRWACRRSKITSMSAWLAKLCFSVVYVNGARRATINRICPTGRLVARKSGRLWYGGPPPSPQHKFASQMFTNRLDGPNSTDPDSAAPSFMRGLAARRDTSARLPPAVPTLAIRLGRRSGRLQDRRPRTMG
jgi:hypothetical protein